MRRKTGKHTNTVVITVLITAALLGSAYYIGVIRHDIAARQRAPEDATWTTLEPRGKPAKAGKNVSAETSSNRTDTIIRCHDPEIGEFFTNAATCAEADPYKRITIAEPLETQPAEDRYSGLDYVPPDQEAGNSRSD